MNMDPLETVRDPVSGGPAGWYERWDTALFADNPRLRDFARQCAATVEIMSLDIKGNRIVATVRHQSQRRITVTAGLPRYPVADWYQSLNANADCILEAGQRGGQRMSAEVLSLLADSGRGLWPSGMEEIQLNVAPHSEQIPCPWCMAVLVETGWLLEQDPLVLFQLRGLHQDDLTGLMAHLQQAQSGRRHAGGTAAKSASRPDFHDEFWGDMRAIRALRRHVENRDDAVAPAYRLGPPPAADQSGNGDLALLVEAIYARARQSE
ncbi:MAG: hypothetical protein J4G06_05360 [Caldilineaceae bacterium]|nr:hypothetical protein [Caldilineaceae bacterium]